MEFSFCLRDYKYITRLDDYLCNDEVVVKALIYRP